MRLAFLELPVAGFHRFTYTTEKTRARTRSQARYGRIRTAGIPAKWSNRKIEAWNIGLPNLRAWFISPTL